LHLPFPVEGIVLKFCLVWMKGDEQMYYLQRGRIFFCYQRPNFFASLAGLPCKEFWHRCMPTKNICTHQFVADENVAGVLVLLFFFRNKTKKQKK
jgi:hypothetical protein